MRSNSLLLLLSVLVDCGGSAPGLLPVADAGDGAAEQDAQPKLDASRDVADAADDASGAPPSALLRSLNISLFDATDQFVTDTKTQTLIASHGVPLLRMPFRDSLSDATHIACLKAIQSVGATPLVIVHGAVPNAATTDAHFLGLAASVFGTGRVLVEFGNEEDLAGVNVSTYTAAWNAIVPGLKSAHPSFAFVGPVNFQANPTYVAAFAKGASPAPDYVSWHEYVCSAQDSDTTCMSHVDNWTTHVTSTNTAVQGQIGHTIPILITEWNLDPNSDPRYASASFIQPWTAKALTTWAANVSNGVYAAMIYTAESHPTFQVIDSMAALTPQGVALFQ